MMEDEVFTADDIEKGQDVLGPEYFAGRRISERFMAQFKDEHFKPLAEEFAKVFRDKLWTDIADWLLVDTESNVHNEIARMVEGTVQAIITGQKWALNRYALAARYGNGVELRAAIVKHVPAELMDARLRDLEAENAKLREDIRWFRDR